MSAGTSGHSNVSIRCARFCNWLLKSLRGFGDQACEPSRPLIAIAAALFASLFIFDAAAAGAQYVYDPGGRLVQVIAADGSSARYNYDPAGNILSITRLTATTLAETGLSNSSGAVGSTLTIYGSGFSTTASGNQVWINGVLCTVVSSTVNSITVIVPAGATSGTIKVTVGTGTVISTSSFAVQGASAVPPTIATLSPQIGLVGSTVTLSGTNFQTTAANNKVYFDHSFATVSAAASGSASVVVPAGYPSGKIALSTPYGTATSSQDFFVPPIGHAVADIGATGRLTVDGAPLAVTLGAAGKLGMVLFNGLRGQEISLQISNQSFQSGCYYGTVTVLGPSPGNGSVGSTNFCTGAARVVLPKTGTYTLLIAPNGTDTGSLTLKLANAPTVQGAIVIGGPAVTATTTVPTQRAQLTFTSSTANQVVSLQISAQTYASYCGYPTLQVIGPTPATTVIANTSFCSGAIRFTLPSAGTYAIVAMPYASDTGSVTLQLYNAPPITGTLTPGGSATTVTTTAPAQQGQLSFTGTANQIVSLQISGQTYATNCLYPTLQVIGPAPATTVIASTSFCSGAIRFTLPSAGTYTVVTTPYAADVGGITLQLYNAPPITGAMTAGGSAATVTTTAPAQQGQLSFTGTANQIVSLQISGQTYATNCNYPTLQVIGPAPATAVIASTSFCSGAIRFTLPSAGTYTIVTTPYAADTGSITLQLYNAPPITGAMTAGGSATTVTTTAPAQQGQLSFTGTANQIVSLQISGQTYATNCLYPTLQVIGPAPATTVIASTSFCSGAIRFTLPSAGTYTVVTTPYAADVGNITLQLYNATPITRAIVMGGAATTVTTTVPAQQGQLSFTGTANQIVSLQISGQTYATNCNYPTLQVIGPAPATAVIASTSFCSGAIRFTLPSAGTYTVVTTPYAADTGSVTLQLYNAPPVTGVITIGGAAVTVTTTVPAQQGMLTFTTSAGNQVVHVIESNQTYPSNCNYGGISLIGPAPGTGNVWSGSFCSGNSAVTLPTVGTYTLVTTPGLADVGSIVLQLQ